MPTYIFHCSKCNLTQEKLYRSILKSLPQCSECGEEMTIIPQATGIVFKGSGFYTTDKYDKKS